MTHVKFNRRPFEGNFNSFVDDLFTELPVIIKNEFNQSGRKGYVPVNIKETEKIRLILRLTWIRTFSAFQLKRKMN